MKEAEARIIEQLDKMVASGRITDAEATRLRATEGTAAFDAVVGEIRARHAGTHMEAAIAEGEMSQKEADGYLERLRRGEHPQGLRASLMKHRPRLHSVAPADDDSSVAD